jgi:hypothetical protein
MKKVGIAFCAIAIAAAFFPSVKAQGSSQKYGIAWRSVSTGIQGHTNVWMPEAVAFSLMQSMRDHPAIMTFYRGRIVDVKQCQVSLRCRVDIIPLEYWMIQQRKRLFGVIPLPPKSVKRMTCNNGTKPIRGYCADGTMSVMLDPK